MAWHCHCRKSLLPFSYFVFPCKIEFLPRPTTTNPCNATRVCPASQQNCLQRIVDNVVYRVQRPPTIFRHYYHISWLQRSFFSLSVVPHTTTMPSSWNLNVNQTRFLARTCSFLEGEWERNGQKWCHSQFTSTATISRLILVIWRASHDIFTVQAFLDLRC